MEARSPYAPFVANLEAQRELLNILQDARARARKRMELNNMDWSEVYQYLKSKYVELLNLHFYNKPELHSSIVRIEYGKPGNFYEFVITDEEIMNVIGADISNAHTYMGTRIEAFIRTNILGEKEEKTKTKKKRNRGNGMSKQQRQIKKEWML